MQKYLALLYYQKAKSRHGFAGSMVMASLLLKKLSHMWVVMMRSSNSLIRVIKIRACPCIMAYVNSTIFAVLVHIVKEIENFRFVDTLKKIFS